MFNKIKLFYRDQQFFPGFLGLLINPFYFARLQLGKAMISMSPEMSGSLLDVGCGAMPYRKIFNVKSYVGLDIDTTIARKRAIADDFYDGKIFPYANQAFDCVLCNQVLEHVFNPDEFLGEIKRVLKPKGKLLLTVPFVWDEHEQPYDYARYSSFGLHALLENNGFTITRHKKLGADATILFQLINVYLYKIIRPWPKFASYTFIMTVIAFNNLIGVIAGKILPDNPDFFLDHVILAEKV